MAKHTLEQTPLHLGLGATAIVQPPFSGMEWYQGYGERHGGDGKEGRLVSMHTFSKPWDVWEVHPEGDEVVLCVTGEITLIQDYPDGHTESVTLRSGEFAINAPGVWHTADVSSETTCLFITAGLGTEIRPR